jgi:peptidoglycan/xylan/chitin deacetylase (PgdA/CDA1 family)
MKRRHFVKFAALGLIAPGLGFKPSNAVKTHLITFSFDDGFKKSFLKLATIHEQVGLHGCFNIIASGHLPEFQEVDNWILPELMGSFDDWNYLVSRGHEVMPHSWKHLNLAKQEPEISKQLIKKCIDYFDGHLDNFNPQRAVFNFPFNASTDELDQYTLTQVRAVRNWGEGEINPLPSKKTKYILGCRSNGPGNNDAWLDEKVNKFLSGKGGWMIFNLHGLDDEGWGPVSTDYFTTLLEKLVTIKNLEIIPTGMAMDKYNG